MVNLVLKAGEWGSVALVIVGILVIGFISMFITSIITDSTKKTNSTKGDDDFGSCLFIIVFAVIVAIISGLTKCKGCSTGSGGRDSEGGYWENTPRHTQLIDSTQKNVNMKIIS